MRIAFQERLTFVIAKVAKRLTRWQGRRVAKAQSLARRRAEGVVAMRAIQSDAWADYRLLKRDRYGRELDRVEDLLKSELKHADSLRSQADYIEHKAKEDAEAQRVLYLDKIEAIYTEKV